MQAAANGMQATTTVGPTPIGAPVLSSPSLAVVPAASSSSSGAALALTSEERTLFCTHHVAALKQIADDKRNQSDDKREELRQLVGIRYRVLIETADTIMDMQKIVERSQHQYADIQALLPHLTIAGTTWTADKSTASRPSQLQLLLLLRQYALAPISIWSGLDAHDFDGAIAIYLAQQRVAERLAEVEYWPVDSQGDHPQLKQLIDATLTQAQAQPSATLAQALAAFFHQHAAYYLEIPSFIGHTAAQRLAQRALPTAEYAAALAALAIVTPSSSSADLPVPERLLLQFLHTRAKIIHDLLWSAEQAVHAFGPSKGRSRSADPTPVLSHACANVLFTMQHAVIDVALLFGSLDASVNPNATMLNKGDRLVREWSEAHVAEWVAAIQTKAAAVAGLPSSASSALPPFHLDSAILRARVSAWLVTVQSLVGASLDRLLPSLLASRRACASFAELRATILKAANWEEEASSQRETTTNHTSSHQPKQGRSEDSGEEENKTEEKSLPRASREKQLTPVEQTAATRKLMLERWEDSCTIVFGRSLASSSTSAAAAAGAFTSPLSLFNLLFFSPMHTCSTALVSKAFERVTLVEKVEEYLAADSKSMTGADGNARGGAGAGEKKKVLLAMEEDEKEPSSNSMATHSATASSAPSASQLHGAREDEVQAIVDSFRRQMRTLYRECSAILDCTYVQSAPPSTSSASTSKFVAALESSLAPAGGVGATSFPQLQRYLQEELTPLLVKKYQLMVEKLVEQLKKKLTDLEQSVLLSMANVTSWRSPATLAHVEQSVFISRVCHELIKQQQLMSLDSILHQRAGGANAAATATPRAATGAPSPIAATLAATSRTAFRIWTRYISSILAEDFSAALGKAIEEMRAQGSGPLGAQYYKQLFSNRNHTGGASAAPLGLYLPLHPSPSIAHLLFQVHHHYYRAFGYHIQSDILTWMLVDIDQALMGVLQQKIGHPNKGGSTGGLDSQQSASADVLKKLSSAAVLQLMFDVQFLFAVLRLPASSSSASTAAAAKPAGGPKALQVEISGAAGSATGDLRSQYAALLGVFESHLSTSLDQIDWLTSKATFVANLHAAVARGAVLYGVLCKTNPLPPTLPTNYAPPGATPAPGGFESVGPAGASAAPVATNIMPLAAVPVKILPLPTSLYPSKHPQPAPAVSAATTAATKMALAASLTASATAVGAAAHSAPSAPAAAAASHSGLSFSNLSSNLSSQLSLANTSAAVNAKAIGDLGSSLLGKLSSNSLWGKKQ